MAHAISGYSGLCKNIHGHSYELHVSLANPEIGNDYILTPGFVMDFKDLKKIVLNNVVEIFDHKLVLSNDFLFEHPELKDQKNLIQWDVEPTVENLLVFISKTLNNKLPAGIKLMKLKLHETKDSYAEWINTI